MSFGSIINTTLIGPLKLVFEVLFSFAYQITENVGVSIILLSLVMNFLVLPLYRCADAMQEKAKNKEAELHDGIAHIKKTFKGNERMMMLQTYYKQNHYSPFSALSGSVSLLLEIPFFIAAYQFLSNAAHLQGASLGPISNLADPDGLIRLGSLSVNFLPFAMTIINIAASVLFLKGAPLKSKIQLYAMAIFFLVFLYTSPSGLVFYWTLNNVFSLVKTIFYKLKNPKTVLCYLSSVSGISLFALVKIAGGNTEATEIASVILAVVLQIPLLVYFLKKWLAKKFAGKEKKEKVYTPSKKIFLLGAAFMAVLVGGFIPSTFLAASPQEFVNFKHYLHPNWYIVSATCLSVGIFLVWFSVFYWLASPKGKVFFERGMWIGSVIMLVDYMFFGTKLGNISASLQYDHPMFFAAFEYLLNGAVVIGFAVGLCFVVIKFRKATTGILTVALVAVFGMSAVNVFKINGSIRKLNGNAATAEDPTVSLSATDKNVVVIMLDRAMGSYLPYILQEMEMRRANGLDVKEGEDVATKEAFLSGFTYYYNTISYGNHTNFAAPALLGGYEYTPVEMNKRDEESLEKKTNEANLVLPRTFTEQLGFAHATVYDPVYTGYQWTADCTVFDPYEKVSARNIIGHFTDENQVKGGVERRHRDFFCFSLMKTMPLAAQRAMYDHGQYNRISSKKDQYIYANQAAHKADKASGIRASFMNNYNTLIKLSEMTDITAEGSQYLFMRNDITHEDMMLDERTYEPSFNVDNTAYNKEYASRFTLTKKFKGVDGNEVDLSPTMGNLIVKNSLQMSCYQTNVAALMQLNAWFESLQERGVYDNTRIIIASDHGYYLDQVEKLRHPSFKKNEKESLERYFPLFMVKDFDSRGEVKVDGTFMTNADVACLATEGFTDGEGNAAKNPFTNVVFSTGEKTAHGQWILQPAHKDDWRTEYNDGNCFNKASWAQFDSTKANCSIWNISDWTAYKGTKVLKEHYWK